MIGKGDVLYDAVVIATLVVIPFTVLCFCSWKILMALKGSRQRIEDNISSMSAVNEEERRVTLILLVIIIAFVISNVPINTVHILGVLDHKIEPWIDLLVLSILMINHASNPVIYGLMNRNFREVISQACSHDKVRDMLRMKGRRNDQS